MIRMLSKWLFPDSRSFGSNLDPVRTLLIDTDKLDCSVFKGEAHGLEFRGSFIAAFHKARNGHWLRNIWKVVDGIDAERACSRVADDVA